MRELKFRAYDTRLKMWCYNGEGFGLFGEVLMVDGFSSHFRENPIDGLGSLDRIYTDIKVMQFTGLKDKNGKEIYEGDIVEQEKWVSVGNYVKSIGVVKYKGIFFTCECVGHWEGSNADLNGNAIVLGNIYENPDLL